MYMRYIAAVSIVIVLLAFFGPMMMSAGRRIRDKAKETWGKEEAQYADTEEEEVEDELEKVRSGDNQNTH